LCTNRYLRPYFSWFEAIFVISKQVFWGIFNIIFIIKRFDACYRTIKRRNNKVKNCVSKIDLVKGHVSKINQLQCMRIAVNRFFKLTKFIWSLFQSYIFTWSIVDWRDRDIPAKSHLQSQQAFQLQFETAAIVYHYYYFRYSLISAVKIRFIYASDFLIGCS